MVGERSSSVDHPLGDDQPRREGDQHTGEHPHRPDAVAAPADHLDGPRHGLRERGGEHQPDQDGELYGEQVARSEDERGDREDGPALQQPRDVQRRHDQGAEVVGGRADREGDALLPRQQLAPAARGHRRDDRDDQDRDVGGRQQQDRLLGGELRQSAGGPRSARQVGREPGEEDGEYDDQGECRGGHDPAASPDRGGPERDERPDVGRRPDQVPPAPAPAARRLSRGERGRHRHPPRRSSRERRPRRRPTRRAGPRRAHRPGPRAPAGAWTPGPPRRGPGRPR